MEQLLETEGYWWKNEREEDRRKARTNVEERKHGQNRETEDSQNQMVSMKTGLASLTDGSNIVI